VSHIEESEGFSKSSPDDISETFRTNLRLILKERSIPAAAISRKAGLNLRAVKDIEEGRAKSPRLVTVFKLAEALDVPPQVLLGLEETRSSTEDDLVTVVRFFLSHPSIKPEHLISQIQKNIELLCNVEQVDS